MPATKGRIAVLIEDHFDQTEYRAFNEFFPAHGYEVEYVSHLWGQGELTFGSNPDDGFVEDHVTVTTEVQDIAPGDYKGVVCIGAYAMDRLRYQTEVPGKGARNKAPAVEFIRAAMAAPGVKVGTICHSLWLLCADRDLLAGRRVTCAHNIVCDVENAGADVVYAGAGTAELVVDGDLITAKHPEVTAEFMAAFVREIEETDEQGEIMAQEKQIREAVEGYVESFNAQDRDRFVGLLAEDVVQYEPVSSPPNNGRDAVTAFFDGVFGAMETVEFKITDLIVTGDEAALAFEITARPKAGGLVRDVGIDTFRVDDDGRITEIKGYHDAAHTKVAEA